MQPQSKINEEFVGRVIDMDGKPVPGATLNAEASTATSDQDGWFTLPSQGLPQWITVTHAEFISRTRAAIPGRPILFRLTPDDGKTTVLHFVGDTMFGRRFYDPNEDDFTTDGLLPEKPTVDDHLRLLAPVKPMLENADFTIVNLETTISDQIFFSQNMPRPSAFHPTAAHVYASHPNSVMALKESGIDIVDLGNNHAYDMLEPGLNNTVSSLDQAGVLHFGAGANEATAWAPVIVSGQGQTIAFVGCTTLRIPLNTPVRDDVPFVASDVLRKGGAAYCAETALRSAVAQAKQQADVVVVMIHGGREYDRTPTLKIDYLTEIAKRAGASLVINHQPHVVGGFSWEAQSLIAWTMGSFLSDQTVWSTLESYMLAVYIREGKVIRAYVEPLIIDGFVPHGVADELADFIARGAAGRVPGPFVVENGAMEVDLDGRVLQYAYTETMDGGSSPGTTISLPQAQWISDFKGPGRLRLGRDLLWVGGLENAEVDSASGAAPLWDLSLGNIQIGPDFAYEGNAGIRLTRGAKSTNDVVTTNIHRVWVEPYSQLSITGMARINQRGVGLLQLSWYSGTSGPSFTKMTQPIEVQTDGSWQPFRFDVQVPTGAKALGLYLRLTPPVNGTATADFDNIRIIEWAKPNTAYSPLYNYVLLRGSGDLTFTQQILPGAESWLNGPLANQIK
jgi:poly-gamma-glutamate synthesis protein (capsule biosynthesis protein)